MQSGGEFIGCGYDFKLRGAPFVRDSSAAVAFDCRKFASGLLFQLHNQGLRLLASSDLSKTAKLTTWLFHRERTHTSLFPFACIGISNRDKLQFINFPVAFYERLKYVVEQNWPKTIKRSKFIGDDFEIKLRGMPWRPRRDSENIQAKTLVKALINELGKCRWFLYGSSNLRGNADALFFMYDPAAPSPCLSCGFVMTLNKNDRLRIIDAPHDAAGPVNNAITDYWPRGIQKEKGKLNAYEFKLKGCPWWANGEDTVSVRYFMCKMFEELLRSGWRVKMSVDLTKSLNDKSVLPFQKCDPSNGPVFCISLSRTDRIRFINAPPNLLTALIAMVRRVWLFGVASERPYGASIELKLNGRPWNYGWSGHDGAHGRVMLAYLIKVCANMGWHLYLSADVSAKWRHQRNAPDIPLDLHSLWFVFTGQSQPGDQASGHSQVVPAADIAPPQYGIAEQITSGLGPGDLPPAYSVTSN